MGIGVRHLCNINTIIDVWKNIRLFSFGLRLQELQTLQVTAVIKKFWDIYLSIYLSNKASIDWASLADQEYWYRFSLSVPNIWLCLELSKSVVNDNLH